MRKWLLGSWLLFAAASASAVEPAELTVLHNGDLAILDATAGIVRESARGRTVVLENFGNSSARDFTAFGDTFLVTLHVRYKSSSPFSRVRRYSATGKTIAEWELRQPGGMLTGIAVDADQQVVYCTDARLGQVYRLDLKSRQPAYTSMARIRDAGVLGPVVLDAKRRRLLVADVQKGRLLAIPLDNPTAEAEVVLKGGTLIEPVSMTLDPAGDRLYIADATRRRVWTGTFNGTKVTLTPFHASQSFGTLTSVATANDGALWVADREKKKIWLFTRDGKTVRTVVP